MMSQFQDSDYLQERMIKMEAELTALKEELSTRSKPSTSSPDHSLTNGSETSSASEKTSSGSASSNTAAGIRKTENIIKDESAEEKN